MIMENLEEFAGAPVRDFDPDTGLEDPVGTAYRVRVDYDAFDKGVRVPDLLSELKADQKAPQLTRLVIGTWDYEATQNSSLIVAAIAGGADRLAGLTALFLGDIMGEEQEISWIQQSDLTPLFDSLPGLVELVVRGGTELALGRVRHEKLEKLVLQSGGLPADVVEAVVGAELPSLKHLELWLGDSNYGYQGSSLDLLSPLLAGERFPALEFLGLMNCEDQDDIARLVAEAPIVERLKTLDLSMGNLSDEGAKALSSSSKLGKLDRLDIHHHYISDAVAGELQALGIEVNLSDRQKPEEYDGEQFRYIAVSE